MKILYHHRTLGDGAEGIHVSEMVGALRALGHEVRVVSLIGEKSNSDTAGRRRWSRIARMMPGVFYEFGEIAYNLKGFGSLNREVRKFRPDAIYDRYASYNYSAVAVGRKRGIPVILEVNSPYSLQRQSFDERIYLKGVIRWFERKVCSDATVVIVVSSALREVLTDMGVPAGNIVVMPNGVDPVVFHPPTNPDADRERLGLGGKVVIGFSGILRPWHGLDMLVEAFGRLARRRKDLHLLIVGDGPSRATIEAAARALGIEKAITVTGRLPHQRVVDQVAGMDIAVSPRATFYSSPMKILEYQAMGKAVVAPDMMNIRDLIRDGETGVLFRPEDAGDLETKLERLLDDADARRELGRRAREWIVGERTWRHNAEAVVRLIEESRR